MAETSIKLTFQEYLNYNDGTDNRYEFVEGKLILMPPATGKHEAIITLLLIRLYQEIQRCNLALAVRPSGTEIQTSSGRRSRRPDLSVITLEQKQQIEKTPAVLQSPPVLVVEVVSPESVVRDYEVKTLEYAAIKIPEYWIVDPLSHKVLVLTLQQDNVYQQTEFIGNERIISQIFPEFTMMVEEVLNA